VAVRPTAASVQVAGAMGVAQSRVRTCIGCRRTAAATELLRVVAAKTFSGTTDDSIGRLDAGRRAADVLVVPDPGARALGRGAWLHPDLECAQLAQRRRAFARALRVPGAADPTPVLELLERVSLGNAMPTGDNPLVETESEQRAMGIR
jgi:uncharacterized protein